MADELQRMLIITMSTFAAYSVPSIVLNPLLRYHLLFTTTLYKKLFLLPACS